MLSILIFLAAINKPIPETPPTLLSQKNGAPKVYLKTKDQEEPKKKEESLVVAEDDAKKEESPPKK